MSAEEVVVMCRDQGFAGAGVIDARPTSYEPELRAWLAAGRHGSMDWLARDADVRTDPSRLLPGATSVIVVADRYAPRGDEDPTPDPTAGRIARYARGRDYHPVIRKRLHRVSDALRDRFPRHAFRSFCDIAPIMEREHAARAGLGWIGKHTLLIDPRLGSYLLLGGVLTTLPIAPPRADPVVPDHCGTCTRCIDACPTDAITPYAVDASRCISYLTIERRGPIEASLHRPIGDWLFGCDVCQEVCPHNSARPGDRAGDVASAFEPSRRTLDALGILGWTGEDRAGAFRTTSLKRARLDTIKRNALIVLGNAIADGRIDEPGPVVERVRRVAGDPDEHETVRATASQVLGRLGV